MQHSSEGKIHSFILNGETKPFCMFHKIIFLLLHGTLNGVVEQTDELFSYLLSPHCSQHAHKLFNFSYSEAFNIYNFNNNKTNNT